MQRPTGSLFPLLTLPDEPGPPSELAETEAFATSLPLAYGGRPFEDLLTGQDLGSPLVPISFATYPIRSGRDLLIWEEELVPAQSGHELATLQTGRRVNLITGEVEELPVAFGGGSARGRELLLLEEEGEEELTPYQRQLLDLPPEILLPILEGLLMEGDVKGVISLCAASTEARYGICQSMIHVPVRFPSLVGSVRAGLLPEWATLLQVALEIDPARRLHMVRCELAGLILLTEARQLTHAPVPGEPHPESPYLPPISLHGRDDLFLYERFAELKEGHYSNNYKEIAEQVITWVPSFVVPLLGENFPPDDGARFVQVKDYTEAPIPNSEYATQGQMYDLVDTPLFREIALSALYVDMWQALQDAGMDCEVNANRLELIPGLLLIAHFYKSPDLGWVYAIYAGLDVSEAPQFAALAPVHDKVYWTYASDNGVTELVVRPKIPPYEDYLHGSGTKRPEWGDRSLIGGLRGRYWVEDNNLPQVEAMLANMGYHRIH